MFFIQIIWYESTFNCFHYLCLLFEEYHVCFSETFTIMKKLISLFVSYDL